jgi:hypothetical protein
MVKFRIITDMDSFFVELDPTDIRPGATARAVPEEIVKNGFWLNEKKFIAPWAIYSVEILDE